MSFVLWILTWAALYAIGLVRDSSAREHLVLLPFRRKLVDDAIALEDRGLRVRVSWWVTSWVRRRTVILMVWPVTVLVTAIVAQHVGSNRLLAACVAGALLASYGALDSSVARRHGLQIRSDLSLVALVPALTLKAVVTAAATWIFLDAWSKGSTSWWQSSAGYALALAVAAVAHLPVVWSERRARRHHRASFGTQATEDTLLYLRAFSDDQVRQRNPIEPGGPTRSLVPFRRVRFEEALSAWLLDVGELVTVGRPGEALPELGATRTYLPLDDWQEAVRETAQRSQAVFLVAGLTDSLSWEIAQLRSWGILPKTLILLPPDPDQQRSLLRLWKLEEVLGLKPLGDWIYPALVAIGFDDDIEPVYYLSVGRDWSEYVGAITMFLGVRSGRIRRPEQGHLNRMNTERFTRRLGLGPTPAETTDENATTSDSDERGGERLPDTATGTMFDLFTDRSRRIVVRAQEAARDRGHDYIGTEHLLLGLLQEEDSPAHALLHSFGASALAIAKRTDQVIGSSPVRPAGYLAFTPRAKEVLTAAFVESESLGHDYIGSEHLLLALTSGDGVAMIVLREFGLETGPLRAVVGGV